MNSVVTYPILPLRVGPGIVVDDDVREQVWDLVGGLYPAGRVHERRAAQRYPYPHLVYLCPLMAVETTEAQKPIVVVGKDISERGLGFYHQQPLPHRLMNASLQAHDGRWFGFLIDINWCRFNHHGWYDSGGRLLEAATPAIAAPGGLFS